MSTDTGTGLAELFGPAEANVFYNGEITVYYDAPLHVYYTVEPDGSKLLVPGVTSVLGIIDKSGPLTQWAANMTVEYLRPRLSDIDQYTDQFIDTGHRVVNAERLEKLLNEARFNFRQISKEAKDIGHVAHEWLDAHIKRMVAHDYSKVALPEDEKARNCVMAALEWMDIHEFSPIVSEHKIFSRKLGVSGTLDWLAHIKPCTDAKCCPPTIAKRVLALGDFKSSKAIYDEYFMQTAVYKYAYEEEHQDVKVDWRIVLRLGKDDGEFQAAVLKQDSFDADIEGFRGALALYHWQKQIDLDKKVDKLMLKAMKVKQPKKTVKRAVIKKAA